MSMWPDDVCHRSLVGQSCYAGRPSSRRRREGGREALRQQTHNQEIVNVQHVTSLPYDHVLMPGVSGQSLEESNRNKEEKRQRTEEEVGAEVNGGEEQPDLERRTLDCKKHEAACTPHDTCIFVCQCRGDE